MPLSSSRSSPVEVPEYETQFEPRPDDHETLWTAREILKEDRHRYLVKWEGIDPGTGKPWDDSWVPKRDCTDELIYEWKLLRAKKAQARKKKRKNIEYAPYPDKGSDRKSGSRNTSHTTESALSVPPIAGPSRSRQGDTSGGRSPVVEIIRPKKRLRESRHFINGERERDVAAEDKAKLSKKRKLSREINDAISSSTKSGQSPPRPVQSRNHVDHTLANPQIPSKSNTQSSHRPKPSSLHKSPHRRFPPVSPEKKAPEMSPRKKKKKHKPTSIEPLAIHPPHGDLEITSPLRKNRRIFVSPVISQTNNSGHYDQEFHPRPENGEDHEERESQEKDLSHNPLQPFLNNGEDGIDPDMDDYAFPPLGNDMVHSNRDISRSPSLPSPRDLLLGTSTIIIPETQPSALCSEPQPHPPSPSLSHKTKRAHKNPKPATSKLGNVTSPKPKSKDVLRPVPTMSPTAFKPFLPQAPSAPSQSQLSSIEMFATPSKSQIKHKDRGDNQKGYDFARRTKKRLAYSQRQEEEGEEDDDDSDHEPNNPQDDAIEDYVDSGLLDHALKIRGEALAEASRAQDSRNRPKRTRRPFGDIVPSASSEDPGGEEAHAGGHAGTQDSMEQEQNLLQTVPLAPELDEGRPIRGHEDLASKPDTLYNADGDENAKDESVVDELGPDDAADAHSQISAREPADDIQLSGQTNYSLVANAALTQQLSQGQTTIQSPTRQLDRALGLLHRKSVEILELKLTLSKNQSKMSELEEELGRLKHNIDEMNKRYGEVSTALDQERAARAAEEGRSEEEQTANAPLTPEYTKHIAKLAYENERLKSSNAQLESDADMLRGLYTQASDAHQERTSEIRTLTRENESLREQATTGVKQAHRFWEAQVHRLETELARERGTMQVLTDQARRTDDDVRRRAALLPVAQRETEAVRKEMDGWKDGIRELGMENTRLRIQVKDLEDEAMARRKEDRERERKARAIMTEDELLWMCPWMDAEHTSKCGALLESREKLRDHFYEAGHL